MFSKKNNLEKKIKLNISSKDLESDFKKRLLAQQSSSDLKGFRKGKAPLDVIEKYYGDQIKQRLIMDKMGDIFYKKISEENIPVVGQPSFAPESFDIKKDIKFEVSYEIYPEFSLTKMGSLSFKKPVSKVTDQDIKKATDLVLKRYGKAEPIDEKSKEGNFVKIDFEGFLNGEKFEGGEAQDYSLELGSKTMIPGFEEQIIGMKAAESKDIEVTFPDDYQAENLKGQKVMFKIKMKEVSEVKLPNLDEEFFKSINMDVKTKAEFEKKIEEQLQTDLKTNLKTKTKQRIFDAFESSNQIDIPQSMIISEANNLRNNTAQQMGLDIGKLEEDQFPIDNFKENALKRVRLGVLINKLIEENNISVDNDTLKKEIEDKSKSFKDPEQYVNWIYGNEEQLKNIESLVLEDKVAEYLEEKSKVEEETLSFEEVVSMG
ncbi:MAG: trigger factor [Gammaproteobacteria bacterium]|jgi:trigger factor|nr:MAG: trigger factor [Gammaproteobacteria bacterium]